MSEAQAPAAAAEQQQPQTIPPHFNLMRAIQDVENLDIPVSIVIEIILKILFNEGEVSLKRFAEITRMELQLLDQIMIKLQHEKIVEVAHAGQLGRYTYVYVLSDLGSERARDAMERSQYIGPVPVPVETYSRVIAMQTEKKLSLTPEEVKGALSHLILPEHFHRSIGPAVNAGTSLFLYGPPGNGKTTIAEAIAELISGTDPIWVPYALTIAGYTISIYDPQLFDSVPMDENEQRYVDKRWGKWKRPGVIVGGELTMEALELRFDPVAKFYEAPLQLKANGGMFLIDDFGRQLMAPQELLNRWIVPLESGVDFLRLRTGQSFVVPFRQLIVFSTNLDPAELVDGAFMRRIQMKVQVTSPDERMFFQIFRIMSEHYNIPLEKEGFMHLVQKWYREQNRRMEAVHPRDLLKIIRSVCEYAGEQPRLIPRLIDEACTNYFVDLDSKKDW